MGGRGADADAGVDVDTAGGNGLVGMRERASVVGGSLQVKDEEESFSWTLRLPRKEIQ